MISLPEIIFNTNTTPILPANFNATYKEADVEIKLENSRIY
jgi:hypothetical protein